MEIFNSQLQLRYAFVSSPNPIRASAAGADPNVINLTVMISNPRPRPVELAGITIEIPMGESSSRTLSSLPNLPAPRTAPSSDWTFATAGGKLTIMAEDDEGGELTSTLIIRLEGITINAMAGVVPITITEISTSGTKAVDNITYALIKQESDFPVTDFWIDPDRLNTFGTRAKLYWNVSDEGKTLSYGLRSNDWQPKDCLNRGDCFSWQDGVAGISTPPLNETTSFTLSVIGTDSSGGRVVKKTLTVTVRLVVPSVLENSFIERVAFDRFVSMHWIAFNATRCAVRLDGKVIDANAPTDTFMHGYPLLLPDVPGRHQLTVIAYGESGVQAPHIFPDVFIAPRAPIGLGSDARAIAITPDSRHALVTGFVPNSGAIVTVIDIEKRTAEAKTIPVPGTPHGIAVTPNGAQALVTGLSIFGGGVNAVAGGDTANSAVTNDGIINAGADSVMELYERLTANPLAMPDAGVQKAELQEMPRAVGALTATTSGVTFIDIATRAALPGPVPVPSPFGVAVTPDGEHAFVSQLAMFDVAMLDVRNRSLISILKSNTFASLSIATTPDGKLALALGINSMAVIDVATRKVEPNHIQLGRRPGSVTVTPDGRLALVISLDEDLMTVVDIQARKAEPTRIPVRRPEALTSQAIAITRDGRFALVAGNGGMLTVVDIPARAVLFENIAIPRSRGIRISPDGQTTILVELGSNQVTVL